MHTHTILYVLLYTGTKDKKYLTVNKLLLAFDMDHTAVAIA